MEQLPNPVAETSSINDHTKEPPRQFGWTLFRLTIKRQGRRYWLVLMLAAYLFGAGSGYLFGWRKLVEYKTAHEHDTEVVSAETDSLWTDLAKQVNPEEGYEIPVVLGDVGINLVASGAIDLDKYIQVFENSGETLTPEQMNILQETSSSAVVINQKNAHFWLNFFWALGLANQNPVLTEGPMMDGGLEKVVNFASTGGWTIAAVPVAQVYASQMLVILDESQQSLLEEVAQVVYRPCCNNATHFPDCNHGMAMLGLLELMASQGASKKEMLEAAKYVSAFWFPQQMLEVAVALKKTRGVDFEKLDPATAVGKNTFSGSGFQQVHQWLGQNGLLEQAPGGGGGCGV